MPVRVKDVASIATTDIDPEMRLDVKKLDGFVNRCALRATAALETPVASFSSFQRNHLNTLFDSLRHTHQTIRGLLRTGISSPASVDALPVARLQLEALYSVCLMLENPGFIDTYLKDSWRKQYVRYLLHKEECKNLPRFSKFLNQTGPIQLKKLRQFANISNAEIATIKMEELGIPLPRGVSPKKIVQFPTPGKIIRSIKTRTRKKMLQRVYPEYQHLSSYVHGSSTLFHMLKSLFDPRSKYRDLFTSSMLNDMFQKAVGEEAIYISYLGLVQSCTELVAIFPNDVDLCATLVEAWQPLVDGSLFGKAIWEIRSRALLGVIS